MVFCDSNVSNFISIFDITINNSAEKLIPTASFDVVKIFATSTLIFDILGWKSKFLSISSGGGSSRSYIYKYKC